MTRCGACLAVALLLERNAKHAACLRQLLFHKRPKQLEGRKQDNQMSRAELTTQEDELLHECTSTGRERIEDFTTMPAE